MVEAPEQDTVEYTLQVGWNMVSVPLFLENPARSAVFPGAVAVYTWDPGRKSYEMPDTIEPWRSYWVAVTVPTPLSCSGLAMTEYVCELVPGWHMLGSLHGRSSSLTPPVTAPAGSALSLAYSWDPLGKSYVMTTALEEGVGYWLAATADCWLNVC
jgi:hypothetical protein